MKPDPESIYSYESYRQFLTDTFTKAKAKSKWISHRWVAMRAGFSSSGFFSRILSGKVNIGPATVDGLVKAMGLDSRAGDYFRAMVDLDQASDQIGREQARSALVRLRTEGGARLAEWQAKFWSHHRYAMVRDALWIEPLESLSDAGCWGGRFFPPLSEEEVLESIELLRSLSLVEQDDLGRIVRSDIRSLSSGYKSSEQEVLSYQISCLELAKKALDESPTGERNISTLTLSIPSARWPEFEAEIRKFRKTLRTMAEESRDEDILLHLNIHAFPVFRKP